MTTPAAQRPVGVSEGPSAREGSGEAHSATERQSLAVIIAHPKMPADERRWQGGEGCDRCPKALETADAVIAAGFRRVSEDDATVARLVWAMAAVDGYQEGELSAASYGIYANQVRAALAALRGGTP